MSDLRLNLSRLGLSQYVERFHEEGFESWDIVLEITESDLEALGVKLGHRRVLQRGISQTRGLSVEQLDPVVGSGSQDDCQRQGGEQSRTDGQSSTGSGQKRKYRRHPKSDENAPERPPSAYVIFSNKIREELKPETLSFTAIAKRVGGRWQDISSEEKEPYESGAAAAKEKYHAQMTEYKTTKSYRDYQQYLAEFEAKHASSSEGKRPKFAPEETHGSTTSSGSVISQLDGLESLSGSTDLARRRVGSVSSVGLHTVTSGHPSPPSITSGPPLRRGGPSAIIALGNTSPMSVSPTSAGRESSTSQYIYNSFLGQPSAEPQSERTAMTSAGSDQNYHRVLSIESKEARTLRGLSLGPFIEPKMSGVQSSPFGSPQRSTRTPTQLQYSTSDSSKSSKASTLSSGSTATSSLLPSASTFDGEKRPALSLPSLATLGPLSSSNGSSHAERATRPSLQPLASRKTSSIAPDQPSQPPFTSSLSTDMSRERSLLGGLNLDQEEGGATPTIPQDPPEPRHPPHHPSLPSLPFVLRDDTHDLFPQQADALSVLAYAGRIVGHDRGTPRPP